MDVDLSTLTIATTKPAGKVAKMLAGVGAAILPIEPDEGNVDRYVLSKRVAIERRTGSGLPAGIMDKSLFTSAIYLRQHFAVPVLILEGEVNFQYSMIDPQATRGAMSSMLLLYGLNVLATPTVEETVSLILMFARQEQIGIPDISLIPKRKAPDLPDLQRRVIEMLPGAGMVMARQLLQHFGSVQRIINATEDDLRAMRGIGAKKARQIVQVCRAEYGAVDTEKDLEDAIEAAPSLLFVEPVTLVARQHHIYTEQKDRHVVDMVFYADESDELVLVELKRGRLALDHYRQMHRYLDKARESSLLRGYLDRGAKLRGLLATAEPCEFHSGDPHVAVGIVDRGRAIDVLKGLRARRLEAEGKAK